VAHQNLAPVRRRARDMRNARFAASCEQRTEALILASKDERSLPAERSKQDLQASVATNVIKGRPLLERRGVDRTGQAAQRMHDEFWRSRRAGSWKDPLCLPFHQSG